MTSYTVSSETAILDVVPVEYECLVIPGSVMVISDAENTGNYGPLTYLSLGDGIQYIGANSFSGAQNLRSVTIPGSVTHIGSRAFPYAEKVTLKKGAVESLVKSGLYFHDSFPNATTVIVDGYYADVSSYSYFDAFIQLAETDPGRNVKLQFNDVTFPESSDYLQDGVVEIPDSAYEYNQNLTAVAIPDSVVNIGSRAFYGCNRLSALYLGKGVSRIEKEAFAGCSFASVLIPSSVTYIGSNAFSTVRTVTIEKAAISALAEAYRQAANIGSSEMISLADMFCGAATIKIEANFSDFDSDNSDVSGERGNFYEFLGLDLNPDVEYIFNDGIISDKQTMSEINPEAYMGREDINFVEIPDSIKSIGPGAYRNCRNLFRLNLGNSVEYIGEYAFSGCGITSVSIPSSVTAIGRGAFNSVQTATIEKTTACALAQEYVNTLDLTLYESTTLSSIFGSGVIRINAKTTDFADILAPAQVGLRDFLGMPCEIEFVFDDGVISDKQTLSEINSNAYAGNTGLTNVTISDDITKIGDGAYKDCTNLSNLKLGKSVYEIGENAFENCAFETVTIPDSVTYIGRRAFTSVKKVILSLGAARSLCSKWGLEEGNSVPLSEIFPNATEIVVEGGNYSDFPQTDYFREFVELGDRVIFFEDTYIPRNPLTEGSSYIPAYAYQNSWFDSVIIPDSVISVEEGAFADSHNLRSVTLGDNVNVIYDRAFENCPIESVVIPNSVEVIGANAFNMATKVTFEPLAAHNIAKQDGARLHYSFPNAVSVYVKASPADVNLEYFLSGDVVETVVFSDGSVWKRGEMFVPNGAGAIEENAYSGKTLNKITIPDSIVTIGAGAFSGLTCNSEEGIPVTMGKNVSYIGSQAFKESCINSVVFGNAPLTIEAEAFASTKIKSLMLPANVISLGENAFNTDSLKAVSLDANVVSGALKENGFGHVFGSVDSVIITGDLTEIPANMFKNCEVSSITYPDSVVSIGSFAFYGSYVTDPHIGNNVLSIGEASFRKTPITALNIPDSVKYVGNQAFAYCSNLKYAKVGSGITAIPEGLFKACSNLRFVELSDNIKTIAANAFNNCSSLERIELPGGLIEIGSNSFENCSSLTKIVIPEGVETIRTGAFKNCTGLTEIVIPESVTTIESGAFEGCTGLSDLIVSNGVEEIQSGAFKNCAALDTVVIPETVEVIGEEAFSGCETTVLAGVSNTAVETYAVNNNIEFHPVNAYPCQGTRFDFENQVIFSVNNNQDDISSIIENATDAQITYSNKFCGTGTTVTITKGNTVEEYMLIVDGDLDGDSTCDVIDASLAQRFSSEIGDAPTFAQVYAAGGKNAEEIDANDYSSLVNKLLTK